MRKYLLLVITLACASVGHAEGLLSHSGLLTPLTSQTCTWEFIQGVGGIRIGAPAQKQGKMVLPVECDPNGVEVTRKPTYVNSVRLAVRKIQVERKGNQIVLKLVRQMSDAYHPRAQFNDASLAGIPAGQYDVFYETAGDAGKLLGHVEIKPAPASSAGLSSLR